MVLLVLHCVSADRNFRCTILGAGNNIDTRLCVRLKQDSRHRTRHSWQSGTKQVSLTYKCSSAEKLHKQSSHPLITPVTNPSHGMVCRVSWQSQRYSLTVNKHAMAMPGVTAWQSIPMYATTHERTASTLAIPRRDQRSVRVLTES